jgi:GNAT superfamily N-acetyltransferase
MIRRATRKDIEFCHTLTVMEDWGYSLQEMSVMSLCKSSTFFIAEEDGPVGMAASFQYGGSAWVGLLIVLEEYRGQGIGTSLMEAVLEDLDSKGVTTVRLEAVHEAVSLYSSLGFVPEFESLRLKGESHGTSFLPSFSDNILEEIAVYDQAYFGADRKEFLKGFCALSPLQLVEKAPRGYLLARTSPAKIGPSVCENAAGFESLLSCALSYMTGVISVGIPECNREGVSIYEQYGFTVTDASLRMVRGKGYDGIPEKICAIGGPEKG